jgi:hypothetical protein
MHLVYPAVVSADSLSTMVYMSIHSTAIVSSFFLGNVFWPLRQQRSCAAMAEILDRVIHKTLLYFKDMPSLYFLSPDPSSTF